MEQTSSETTFGPAFEERLDGQRIRRQMDVIRENMLGRRDWATLTEIALATGFPEASVSAQLRHLRKSRFGGYKLDKQRRHSRRGLWEYKLSKKKAPFSLDGGP